MPWQDDEWTLHYKNRFKQAEEARRIRKHREKAQRSGWDTPDIVKGAITVLFSVAAVYGVFSALH